MRGAKRDEPIKMSFCVYTCSDSDVILFLSMPTGFRRHLVGKTLRNVCYSDVT